MASYTPPASFTTTQTLLNSPSSPSPMEISPSSLDTIPALTSILSRLQTASGAQANPAGSSPYPSSSQSQTQTQSQTPSAPKDLINPFSTAPISTKDVPAATDAIKHRLQKARAQASQLPDMERSIEEQEDEIRELETRIREQREVLRGLKALGARLVGGMRDEEMQM